MFKTGLQTKPKLFNRFSCTFYKILLNNILLHICDTIIMFVQTQCHRILLIYQNDLLSKIMYFEVRECEILLILNK